MMYVVNTMAERIGTDSDEDIITSMLERGYVVAVLDYLNNEKAVSPALDYSVQAFRSKIIDKTYLTDSVFPNGTYQATQIVPAGYDVRLNGVFWELDKHGSDGTFEKIVDTWNDDFRYYHKDKVVRWVRPDGTRKPTQNAHDGSTPIWYDDANGTTEDTDGNGKYLKIKHTKAEVITDCVNQDGTPLDLNLYINVVYPTNPNNEVPVMVLASSSNLYEVIQKEDRPHFNGFLFNGYATAVFDYLYAPMGYNSDFGYFDGKSAVTKEQMTYSVHIYNDTKIDTAAIRYLRYLALSESETFKFDTDAFGYYGNSKGGWATFLGEEVLQSPTVKNPEDYETTELLDEAIHDNIVSFTDKRQFVDHHGETRYDNGATESYEKDGYTVDGGERQPWLTYNGQEIISGVQLTYASNGSGDEYISKGHAPTIVAAHMYDTYNSAYGTANSFVNLLRNHDIPTMFFEVPLGHTMVYGIDINHGVDTYQAFCDFNAYYLKHAPVKVFYVSPKNNLVGVNTCSDITVRFSGTVTLEEITKVTITCESDSQLEGTWTSAYGGTEWTFSPLKVNGSTKYTVNIPATLKGDNGKEMGEAYTSSFTTEYASATSSSSVVNGSEGRYVSFTAPTLASEANKFVLRFRVTNDAANIANVYAIPSFDASAPDSSVKGELLGSVNLKGAGYYEIDVTEYIADKAGKTLTLLISEAKTAGVTTVSKNSFESGVGTILSHPNAYSSFSSELFPDSSNKALKVIVEPNDSGEAVNNDYYQRSTLVFRDFNLIKSTPVNRSDYGRKFTVSLKIYSEKARMVQLKLNDCTDTTNEIMDYDIVIQNVQTKAGEWIDVSFDYVVYDKDYGAYGESINKTLFVYITPDGNDETPIWFDDIKVVETVTDVEYADEFALVQKNDGGIAYKAPSDDKAFTLYNGSETVASYDSWNDALSAYKIGYTLSLNRNYTITDSDLFSGFSAVAGAINIDLNGYTVTCGNTKNSLFWLKTDLASTQMTSINVRNGQILVGDTPLVSYGDSAETGSGKTYELNFSYVTFGITDDAYVRNYMSDTQIAADVLADVNISIDTCVFNIPDSKLPNNYVTLFPTGTDELKLSYEIAGGAIKLSSQRWVSIRKNILSVCKFAKNSRDVYTTLEMPTTESPADCTYMKGDAISVFGAPVVNNGVTSYSLVSAGDHVTKYGVIPEEYADAEKYPFVYFDNDGNFKGAFERFYKDGDKTTVIESAKNYLNGNVFNAASGKYTGTVLEATILMRDDYTLQSDESYNNLSQIKGVLNIDLGGFTLTKTTSSDLFVGTIKAVNNAFFPTTINIKNGFVVTKDNSVVSFRHHDSVGTGKATNISEHKIFTMNFDGVGFKLAAESAVTNPLIKYNSASGTYKASNANAFVSFSGCTFDYQTVASSNAITVFNAAPATSAYINVNITVNGGMVQLNDSSKVTFAATASGSTLKFGTYGGEYVTLDIESGSAPTAAYTTVSDGNLKFYKIAEKSYSLINLVTKYGTISETYASPYLYPFVYFDEAGNCKYGANTFYGNNVSTSIVGKAKDYLSSNVFDPTTGAYTGTVREAHILMRRDYELASNEAFHNLAQIQGVLNIDLGGYTITSAYRELFTGTIKGWGGSGDVHFFPTTINMNNGSVVMKNSSVVSFKHHDGFGTTVATNISQKTFAINFDVVEFKLSAESTATDPLIKYESAGGTYKDSNANAFVSFNGCIFDYQTQTSGNNITIFNLSPYDNSYIISNVTVNGGKVLLDDASKVTFAKTKSGSTLKFGTYNGEYVMLDIKTGSAPTIVYDTLSEGKALFKAAANDGEYILTPCDHSGNNACDDVCKECGTALTPAHDYNVVKNDENNHWNECECGAKSSEEPHNYTVCKYSTTEHWFECACGVVDEGTREEHKGGEATGTDRKTCSVCNQKYGAVSGVSFAIKTSITLGSRLSINIYIPQKSLLKFTLNDVEYSDLEDLNDNLVELDGEYYYRISKPLDAKEAASELKLTVCINSEENILNGSFTMSIPKYAEKVLASENEVEKTLVRDVLSYIRAAYAYFDTVDEEAIAKIDTMLGENYDANNAPALNGSPVEPTAGLSRVTYILNATPTIRFHITGESDTYAFYVNGVKLNTIEGEDENGKYLQMDVYAYAMGETISYTINDVESGSYHINCYYTFVTTDDAHKNNAELINLVARFAKYCESAAAYRDSVLKNS